MIKSELQPQVLCHWSEYLNLTEDVGISLKLTESSKMKLTDTVKVRESTETLNKSTALESTSDEIKDLIVENFDSNFGISDVAYQTRVYKSKKANAIKFAGKPLQTVFLCLKENSKNKLTAISDIKGVPCPEYFIVFFFFCSLIETSSFFFSCLSVCLSVLLLFFVIMTLLQYWRIIHIK